MTLLGAPHKMPYKRIVMSWIATDLIWAALFIYVQKRRKD
jgi:hypothetical protein